LGRVGKRQKQGQHENVRSISPPSAGEEGGILTNIMRLVLGDIGVVSWYKRTAREYVGKEYVDSRAAEKRVLIVVACRERGGGPAKLNNSASPTKRSRGWVKEC